MLARYFSREHFNYLFGVLSRPLDTFYEIRHRDMGSVPLAVICVFLLSVFFTLNRIFAGFVVNLVNPRTIDLFSEMGAFFLIISLFCIGNWAVTCLMEGEGRMRDIITVAGYAMLPIVLILMPATLFSRFISMEEAAFYHIIIGVAIAWSVLLLLIGVMIVHNYTLLKTLITLILTFVAILVLVFIGLLMVNLFNQIYGFLWSLYTEIVFRF